MVVILYSSSTFGTHSLTYVLCTHTIPRCKCHNTRANFTAEPTVAFLSSEGKRTNNMLDSFAGVRVLSFFFFQAQSLLPSSFVPTISSWCHISLRFPGTKLWPALFPEWKGISLGKNEDEERGHGLSIVTQDYTAFEFHPDIKTYPNLARIQLKITVVSEPEDAPESSRRNIGKFARVERYLLVDRTRKVSINNYNLYFLLFLFLYLSANQFFKTLSPSTSLHISRSCILFFLFLSSFPTTPNITQTPGVYCDAARTLHAR